MGALTRVEREQGQTAAQLAGKGPLQAIHWLHHQAGVARAQVGPDGHTIDVRFGDGHEVAILPLGSLGHATGKSQAALVKSLRTQVGAGNGKAVVLEPFAAELDRGPNPGKMEADALARAGFTVDVVTNGDVTIPVMEQLANYSVVYMETHSGLLPGGDAVITLGEADIHPYTSFIKDHSVIQAFVAGDPHRILYNAIIAGFVTHHMGTFQASSLLFLNGCKLLAAPVFWNAFQQQNVSTMVSWDGDAGAEVTDAAATVFLGRMAAGDDVRTGLAAVQSANLGTSAVAGIVAHLGFLGDGGDTLARALGAIPATATVTPTASPTVTPAATLTPTPTPAKKHKAKCKRGYHRVHGKCRRIAKTKKK